MANKAGQASPPLEKHSRFGKIPKLIKGKGRAAGFVELRDMLLKDWEGMSARMNPYSAFKLILETDRHAMFAEVAAEKQKGTFDRELWDQFRDYLHGSVEAAPDTGATPEVAAGADLVSESVSLFETLSEGDEDNAGSEDRQEVDERRTPEPLAAAR